VLKCCLCFCYRDDRAAAVAEKCDSRRRVWRSFPPWLACSSLFEVTCIWSLASPALDSKCIKVFGNRACRGSLSAFPDPLAGIKRAALQQGRNGKEGTEMVEKGRRGFIRLPPISGSEARATPSISDNLFFPVHFGTAQSQKTMVPLYGYVSKHFTVCDSSFCGLVVATLIISYEQCINWHWYHFISKNEKSCLGACQPIACRLDKSYRFHDIQQYVKVYCSKSTCFANTVAKHSGVRILVSVLIQQSLQPSNLS